jgi:oligogalacturonide lyase
MNHTVRFAGMVALSLCVRVIGAQPAQPASTAPTIARDMNTGATYELKPTNGQPPPKEWVDKDTGHRVVRLTDEPYSQSLYFNYPAYTPDGKKMAFFSPTGIYQLDLESRASEQILPAISTIENQKVRNNLVQVGLKTGRFFITRTVMRDADAQGAGGAVTQDRGSAERSVWWIDPATREEHLIGKLPPNHNLATVNCDETMLCGAVTYLDGRGGAATQPVRAAPGQRINLGARWSQHLPMALLTMNALTGELKTFNPSNDWDNHFLCSPTDPNVLMYCHEGPWQNNDRIWTINLNGSNLKKVHARTMINEIWGHEFWSADGTTSWYQLYYPRGDRDSSWIAGTNLKTGAETWYHLEPDAGSIHVNISPDGRMFCGDGNNSCPWIFIHIPTLARNMAVSEAYDTKGLIQPGTIHSERLVNMSNHQYQLEPNPRFTPDMKWVIFRSNMFGPSYVFAVEVAKAGS